MQTFSIQSGSNGNAIYVEAAGVRLLIDAGVSARLIRSRLAEYGRSAGELDALLVSHDHSDHVRGVGAVHRLFGVPVWITPPTHRATHAVLGRIHSPRYFFAGQTLEFGAGRVRVHTIPTPHDAADGVAFVVEAEGRRLGILTDLGHPFAALRALLGELDAAYLESNYDPDMLDAGNYPPALKARIRGDGGHLSNDEAAGLLRACPRRLSWVALAHLSQNNNQPELALETHRRVLGGSYPLLVAGRHAPTPLLSV